MVMRSLMISMVACLAAVGAYDAQARFLLNDGDVIVFLGDSITQAGAAPEGYVTLFDLFCGVNGYEVKVINAGISGHKSDDMLARLDRDVLSKDPDWVSISCGVNDVWHQFMENHKGVPLDEYKKNMTEMVDRIQAKGAKVLLLTATVIYEDLNSDQNKMLKGYNDFLREFAKEKNLLLCDLNKAFQERIKQKMFPDQKLLTVDGVHMNPRGNRLMAREILRALGAEGGQIAQAEKRWELINNMGKEGGK
ncbi:MAG: G-D-S-L family lipolytic protein [bacterium]|nr:G-D-S-L family lipolytic protein [bacterium]